MYICLYIYVCACVWESTFTRVLMCLWMRACLYTMRICIHADFPSISVPTHCCIYTYVYTYMHACIHTYTHACMHACIHTYIQTYIHTNIHTHIHTHILTCIHTYICTHVEVVHMYTHKYTQSSHSTSHTHTRTRTHAHAHTHTHIHTHALTHTHTNTKPLRTYNQSQQLLEQDGDNSTAITVAGAVPFEYLESWMWTELDMWPSFITSITATLTLQVRKAHNCA